MLAVLTETAADYGITNVDLRQDRWSPDGPSPSADVAFISYVGYDIEEIGPFLDGLEAAASRTCVAVLMERSPLAAFSSLWPAVHGEPQAEPPGLNKFLVLLLARGALPEMRIVSSHEWGFDSREEAESDALRRLWVAPDGVWADRLRAALRDA